VTETYNKDYTIILGATATGKTRYAIEWAKSNSGIIYSADSRQIYQKMDIGTGKDLKEYGSVPYRMIDIARAGERWHLFQYLEYFHKTLKNETDHKPIIICGGTGLYLSALIFGYRMDIVDPNHKLRDKLERLSTEDLARVFKSQNINVPDTRKRMIRGIEVLEAKKTGNYKTQSFPPLQAEVLGIKRPKNHKDLIRDRLVKRLQEGLIEEVQQLNNEISPETLKYYGLEYKYIQLYLEGELSYDAMKEKLFTEICRYAKRQMTWFRGMERKGIKIEWINP
jgi:tRNA dimethylallyltransferase